MKGQATGWEKLLVNHIFDNKDLYPEFMKNSQKSTIRKQTPHFLKAKDLNKQLTKEQ